MKEIKDIIRAYDAACAAGGKSALATVVSVEGSSYRRPGARMLVREDGQLTGAISGGCLEGDALRKALLAINENRNKLVTYDTSDEDDARFGVQLGCNGIVHILFEPIQASVANNPIELLKRFAANREPAVLVSLFSLEDKLLQPGLCMLAAKEGTWDNFPNPLNEEIQQDLKVRALEAFSQNQSLTSSYVAEGTQLTAYIELLQPPLSLVICGAGNDAIPLAEAGYLMGWDVHIIDGRQSHATATRFPQASSVIVSKAEQALNQVALDSRTAWVLMTHNYNYDLEVFRKLAQTECKYIGILGPRKKMQRMLDELEEKGLHLNEATVRHLYSPVGLDIGAETAEEIAISIAAEIKAVFSKTTPRSLREKSESIHNRDEQRSLNSNS
jgi:xanthine dehydrogenase accessory factor